MSHLSISLASVCVFLLTYLLHSTVAVVVVGTIAYRLRRTVNPELRVLMWKMVLLLPVATTLAITVLHTPHFGFQFLIASSSTDVPSAVHETLQGTRHDLDQCYYCDDDCDSDDDHHHPDISSNSSN